MPTDYRPAAKKLIDNVASTILEPAGFSRVAPTIFIRPRDNDTITHVIYFSYGKYTKSHEVVMSIQGAVILNDHPHTQAIADDKARYASTHDGKLHDGYMPLEHPRDNSRKNMMVIDSQTDVQQLERDVQQAVEKETRFMDKKLGSKRALLRRAYRYHSLKHGHLHHVMALARYYALTDKQPKRVEKLWKVLTSHYPNRFSDENKPDFYDENFYRPRKP